jgi:cellulose synthase (UDP-forming)
MKIQASVRFNNGRTIRCWTTDYSEGGVGLLLPSEIPKIIGDEIHLTMYRGDESYTFKGHVTLHSGRRIGMQFTEMTMEESADFIQCTFARADSWAIWADKRAKDTPLRGLLEVLSLGCRGLKIFTHALVKPIINRRSL